MRDFNTVKADLIRHLNLSCQKTDGEILWYDGTLELLVEFLSILRGKAEKDAFDAIMGNPINIRDADELIFVDPDTHEKIVFKRIREDGE